MDKQQNSDSILGYLAATAPALLQLIAVLSSGLVNVLKISDFVLIPGFLNIANFLVVLLAIDIISLASFWDYNKFSLLKHDENIFSQTKKFWNVLKIACIILFVGLLVFVAIVINKNKITSNIEIWAYLQWTSYILFMTAISFVIYAYVLLKVQERNNKNVQLNYTPRLLDSLRRNGHVKNPDIIIDSINKNSFEAIVRFDNGPQHKVMTDFTGEMVSIEKI